MGLNLSALDRMMPKAIASGGNASPKAVELYGLPPGYDGLTTHAIADLKAWVRREVQS